MRLGLKRLIGSVFIGSVFEGGTSIFASVWGPMLTDVPRCPERNCSEVMLVNQGKYHDETKVKKICQEPQHCTDAREDNANELIQMGAIGGTIVGASVGAIASTLTTCGFFHKIKNIDNFDLICTAISTPIINVPVSVISGTIGHVVLNQRHKTIMDLKETAVLFATSASVNIPFLFIEICIAYCFCLLSCREFLSNLRSCDTQEETVEDKVVAPV